MRLLIITQKVDREDPILGFFHRWIEEFSKNCESVLVICLQKGDYSLPENVRVLSLGKEEGKSRFKYVWRFYRYIWQERKSYDSVFVHMNQAYAILGGLFWRLSGKKVGLWYVHRQKGLSLWLAEKLVDVIFTAVKGSFTLKSKKVLVVGHGIDVEVFSCPPREVNTRPFILLQVGRITPIKHCEIAIEVLALLGRDYRLKFIGEPATDSDRAYLEDLKRLVVERGVSQWVEFAGSVPNSRIKGEYCKADLTLNLVPTGGLDKAALESMACGVRILTTNESFRDLLRGESIVTNNPKDVASRIRTTMNTSNYSYVDLIRDNHNLANLIPRILSFYHS